jgi:hypothetical protein
MAKRFPPESVEKARALAEAGASTDAIAESTGASPSTVRRWLRMSSACRRSGHPPTARPSPSPRAPSVEPSATADEQAGAPPASCGGRCSCGDGPALTPEDVCRRLERRLADLVDRAPDAEQSGRVEDRMLKICRIIEFLRSGDEIGPQLRAIHNFASFCIRTLSESDMGPVRMAVTRYLDELKKEHS